MPLTAAQQQWLTSAIPGAQSAQQEFGVPASVTLAQAIIESGWGAHHIGIANNYFGIKAFTVNGQVTFGSIAIGFVTVPTNEVVNGKTITVQANFRKYNSMADSFRDHGQFLKSNSRYAPAFQHSNDGIAFARAIAAAGYATAPNYGDVLVGIINSNHLTQFDTGAASGSGGTSGSGSSSSGSSSSSSDSSSSGSSSSSAAGGTSSGFTDAGTTTDTSLTTDTSTDGTDTSTDGTDTSTDSTDTTTDGTDTTDSTDSTDTSTDATDTSTDGTDTSTDSTDTSTDETGTDETGTDETGTDETGTGDTSDSSSTDEGELVSSDQN